MAGYVDVILDTQQAVSWTWTADQTIVHHWRLRCSDGGEGEGEGVASSRGSGAVTGTAPGCKLNLFWQKAAAPTRVQVLVIGDGSGVKAGLE